MIPTEQSLENFTLNIVQEIHIAAPLEVAFETLLEQIGPMNERSAGDPMPMTLEPWPGGRWYRDLAMTTVISGGTCRPSKGQRCLKSAARSLRPIRSSPTYNIACRKPTAAP